jgi:pimeloyl-ACP methyl ester carboxylesterase
MHAIVSPSTSGSDGATDPVRALPLGEVPVSEIRLHGHRVTYRQVGHGPVLVLIHGVTSNMQTWDAALPWLADRFTVITPDLLGHGLSAKPRGDYSLGAFASGIRDLLGALGHFRATVVGHSLGGGIAMQMAYQLPEHCERLVLVCSGGLGEEVSIALRAASLPGSEVVIPMIAHNSVVELGRTVGGWLDRIGIGIGPDKAEVARGYASLSDPEARHAFIHTMRAVIDHRGQRVSARDRLYLTETLPSMLLWGARDPIIPARHGERAHEEMPGSRLEVFEGAGHFPHVSEPQRFARTLIEFVDQTEPADLDNQQMREILLAGTSRISAAKTGES